MVSVGERPRSSQARMVDGSIFSEPQGPVACEKGEQRRPAERQQAVMENTPAPEPLAHRLDGTPQEGKRGREESKLRNQRRRVEGSATRWGSLTTGAASCIEPPSTKRRRSAWLRAIRL